MGLISSFYNQGRGRPGKATNPKPQKKKGRPYKEIQKGSGAKSIAAAYDAWQEKAARERHNSGLSNKDYRAAKNEIRGRFARARAAGYTFVYALVDPRDQFERFVYVGKTGWPKIRLEQHIADMDKCNPQKTYWMNRLAKEGVKPKMIILEQVKEENWKERERAWIKSSRFRLVNMTEGGDQSSR